MVINKHTLANGLTIVHSPDSNTKMIAVNILYKVGSRNEDEDRTGFAHLFEHLMFGGSVNIPDYDTPLQLACGENNAFTTCDYIFVEAEEVRRRVGQSGFFVANRAGLGVGVRRTGRLAGRKERNAKYQHSEQC